MDLLNQVGSALPSTYTRQELIAVVEGMGKKMTSALWKTFCDERLRVSRGIYNNPMSGGIAPVQAPQPVVQNVVPMTQPTPVKNHTNKDQRRMTTDQFSYIPEEDPEYVPFGNYKDLERIIKSKMFFPVLITGHSGNGKSTSVLQICAKQKRPVIRINMTKRTDEEALIGSKTLIDGNIVVVEGPLLVAMRSGAITLIDEISAADANTILCLQSIMEGRPYYFASIGEYITPAPGFNIIMTDNTKGKGSEDGRYIGTNVLNEAFLDRIGLTFEQEYPSANIEKKIVLGFMRKYGGEDETFAQQLVDWAAAIRKTFDEGGVDEVIATRRLEHIVRANALFDDKKKAIELGCARFDTVVKVAFIDLFEKMFAPKPTAPIAPEVKGIDPAAIPATISQTQPANNTIAPYPEFNCTFTAV